MQNAMWLASVFGPMLLIMGVWSVFYHDQAMKAATAMKTSPACLMILAVINLLLGLLIINTTNEWTMAVTALVSLLGWVFLIRGLIFLFMPKFVTKYLAKKNGMYLRGVIGLIWGLVLCWLAFWI